MNQQNSHLPISWTRLSRSAEISTIARRSATTPEGPTSCTTLSELFYPIEGFEVRLTHKATTGHECRLVNLQMSTPLTKKAMSYREWSRDEIAKLVQGVEQYKRGRGVDWKNVAKFVGTGRSERQCQDRYLTRTKDRDGVVTKTANTYCAWTVDEENLLRELVSHHGHKWAAFVDYFPGKDANKIKAKFYNQNRASGQNIEQGSSYDSSFVEQQRSCVSQAPDNTNEDFYQQEDTNFWRGNEDE